MTLANSVETHENDLTFLHLDVSLEHFQYMY